MSVFSDKTDHRLLTPSNFNYVKIQLTFFCSTPVVNKWYVTMPCLNTSEIRERHQEV